MIDLTAESVEQLTAGWRAMVLDRDPSADVRDLVLVATEPEQERRGYGEAVTRKALYEAWRATGITRATLHATAAGAPVYTRIGYEPNSLIRFYALKD